MARRITIKAFSYAELEDDFKKQAIAQLKEFEVSEPLAVLEAIYTSKGLYIPPAFLEAA